MQRRMEHVRYAPADAATAPMLRLAAEACGLVFAPSAAAVRAIRACLEPDKAPPAAPWTHGATAFLLLGTWVGDAVGDSDGASDAASDGGGSGVPFLLVPVRRGVAAVATHGGSKRAAGELLFLTGEPFINPLIEEAAHAHLAFGGARHGGCTRGCSPRPLDALATYAQCFSVSLKRKKKQILLEYGYDLFI